MINGEFFGRSGDRWFGCYCGFGLLIGRFGGGFGRFGRLRRRCFGMGLVVVVGYSWLVMKRLL